MELSAKKTDGVFCEESAIKHAHILDSASNMAAISAQTSSDSANGPVNPLYDLCQMEPEGAAKNPVDMEAWCGPVKSEFPESHRSSQDRVTWYKVKYYIHTRAPKMVACRNYRQTNRFGNMSGGSHPFELMPPTSEHSSGVNMLF